MPGGCTTYPQASCAPHAEAVGVQDYSALPTRRGLTDIRFIVTNLSGKAKALYEEVYCTRVRMENMIKEHKLYPRSDRTSCHRWEANQFRLFLHSGADWLLRQLRQAAPLAVAQGDVRNHPPRLPQDRRAHRGTQAPRVRRRFFPLLVTH